MGISSDNITKEFIMNSVSSVEDEFAGHAGEAEGFEYLELD